MQEPGGKFKLWCLKSAEKYGNSIPYIDSFKEKFLRFRIKSRKMKKSRKKNEKTLDKYLGLWYYNKAVFTEEQNASVVQW